jgi:hypothetical protein
MEKSRGEIEPELRYADDPSGPGCHRPAAGLGEDQAVLKAVQYGARAGREVACYGRRP